MFDGEENYGRLRYVENETIFDFDGGYGNSFQRVDAILLGAGPIQRRQQI